MFLRDNKDDNVSYYVKSYNRQNNILDDTRSVMRNAMIRELVEEDP